MIELQYVPKSSTVQNNIRWLRGEYLSAAFLLREQNLFQSSRYNMLNCHLISIPFSQGGRW